MDLAANIVWPETAPGIMGNPREIEKFLKNEILSRQITLIGELDLTSPTSYAGVDWSLFELANYLASKDIIKNSLKSEQMVNWSYPATLAIWTVGKAQTADDGAIKMWDLPDYSSSQLANLATMFTKSLEILELPTFDGDLLGPQKHVQLARIHAMIPDFATQRYSELIQKAVKYNQSKLQILNNIIEDTVISKGVRRLFSARQDIGLDLVERSFNYLAYGYELDLPERLRSKLNKDGIQRKTNKKVEDFPSVIFQEFSGSIEILGAAGWQIVDEEENLVGSLNIPAKSIYALKSRDSRVKILDPSHGYLIFDINGNLLYGNTLPLGGGYIIWHESVKIVSEIDHIEEGYLPHWPEWTFTYFQNLTELTLQLSDSSTKRLEGRKVVTFSESIIPNMLDANKKSIYASYPLIDEAGYVTVTDNISGEQIELFSHSGPVLEGTGGAIDLKVSAGLGKSKSFQGLVIPGISVSGLNNAMPLGSTAKILINLPDDWHFSYPEADKGKSNTFLEFKVKTSQEINVLRVKDPAQIEHFIGFEVPVLSWSVVFEDRESVTIGSALQLPIKDRKKVKALILHGVNEYIPMLNVGSVPVPGRKRGEDARYDLRLLSDVLGENESSISMKWNYEEFNLVTFVKPISRKMSTVEQKDLATIAIAKKIISEDDWNSYQAERHKESQDLRELLRRQRGRY